MVNATESPLVSAQKKCAPGAPYAQIGDNGSSLNVLGEGEEDSGLALSQLECTLAELKTPDSVIAEMYSTRAADCSMGRHPCVMDVSPGPRPPHNTDEGLVTSERASAPAPGGSAMVACESIPSEARRRPRQTADSYDPFGQLMVCGCLCAQPVFACRLGVASVKA